MPNLNSEITIIETRQGITLAHRTAGVNNKGQRVKEGWGVLHTASNGSLYGSWYPNETTARNHYNLLPVDCRRCGAGILYEVTPR